jgi:hypothetical protein
MNLQLDKIRAALHDTFNYPRLKRRIQELTNDELAEADRIEHSSKRRRNMLMALKTERQERAGKVKKMAQLKVEARV